MTFPNEGGAPVAPTTPATPAAEPPSDSGLVDLSTTNDYADLLAEDDFGDSSELGGVSTPEPLSSPTPPAEGQVPAVPAQPAPATPASEQVGSPMPQPSTEGVQPPPQTAAPVTPPVTPESSPKPATQPMTSEQTNELWAKHIQKLEQDYSIPAELVLDLHAEPEKVIPKLAAGIHVRVLAETMRAFQTQLPQLVQQAIAQSTGEDKARNAFYERWPDLKPYEKQVLELGAMFRKVNPTLVGNDAIERIGMMAYSSLGLPLPPKPGQQVQTPAAPTAPAFTPAMPGAGSVGLRQSAPTNIFTDLANEMADSEFD